MAQRLEYLSGGNNKAQSQFPELDLTLMDTFFQISWIYCSPLSLVLRDLTAWDADAAEGTFARRFLHHV